MHDHYAKMAQKMSHLYIATIFTNHFTYVYHNYTLPGENFNFCHLHALIGENFEKYNKIIKLLCQYIFKSEISNNVIGISVSQTELFAI